jgi:EAL and modified HD-GYP domain-containing signal transduction protein
MTADPSIEVQQDSISLTRLPVFDVKRRLWGYELYCFTSGTASTGANEECAGLRVANSAYIGLQYILNRGKKILIHHSAKSILDNLPYALPADSAIVKVDEDIASHPDVLDILKRLKSDKFAIAIDGYTANPAYKAVYPLADIICVNTNGRREEELAGLVPGTQAYKVALMAAGLQTSNQFDLCRDMGFSYFSGPFFKKPDMVQLRKMSSNEVARFNLLGLLEAREPDLEKLVENIEADVTISFRLLAYLNSAAFGLRQKIKSVQQAVTMLGWNKMKNWLRVVLVTDVSQHKDAMDLTLLSAQRGRFLEQVVSDHDYWGFDADSVHLLGLFSLLDVMLGLPMEEIVNHLPLDAKLKTALCGDPSSEYFQLLKLARLFEEAKWVEADDMIQQLSLNKAKVKAAFQKAVDWAAELTTMYAPKQAVA